jgi:hypothetical protein
MLFKDAPNFSTVPSLVIPITNKTRKNKKVRIEEPPRTVPYEEHLQALATITHLTKSSVY